MGWYRVVKTIKGRQYAYEQQTYREGGRVRTRNRYLGPVGGDKAGGSGAGGLLKATTTPTTFSWRGLASFGKAMLDQFDVGRWGLEAASQLGLVNQRKAKKARKPRKSKPKKLQFTAQLTTYSYTVTVKYVTSDYSLILSEEKTYTRQAWVIENRGFVPV
jgi:hypothetical protein